MARKVTGAKSTAVKKKTAKKKNNSGKNTQKTLKPAKSAGKPAKSSYTGTGRFSGRRTDKAPVYAISIMVLLTAVILLVNRNLNNNVPAKREVIVKNDERSGNVIPRPDGQSEKTIAIENDKVKDKEEKAVVVSEKSLLKDVNIFLVKYNEKNEKMSLAPIKRKVASDSPLRETLSALLKGPTAFEKKRGLLTAIPDNLKIRDIKIRNRTAVLDFNNAIEENANGNILLMRIDQLVYTATQFDGIDNIEIMVDGKLKKHFGGEGLFIDGPIARK